MARDHNNNIGQSQLRREDAKLVTGMGCFAGDVKLDNLLQVSFARSYVPAGRIVACDLNGALNMPGVAAVFSGKHVCHLGNLSVNPVLDIKRKTDFPILAFEEVEAVGQPIAAVLATSVNLGLDALEAVLVDIQEEDARIQETALSGSWKAGDVERQFAQADHIVEVSVDHPRLAPSPLEPRGITVKYDSTSDSLTVWCSTQTPHRARTELARILDIDPCRIRVIAPDVGGAFGMKASLYPEEVFTVWAALNQRRSTRWIASRADDFLSATHGRGASSSAQMAITEQGDFLAIRARIENPLGHWLPTSAAVPSWNAGRILPCGYRIESVDIETEGRLSNTAPVGIYRGAGRPEAACLMERLVDEAAVITGIDPIDLRLKNLLSPNDLPYTTATGIVLDSGRYAEAIEILKKKANYEDIKANRDRRRAQGELVGVGVAFYIEPCGSGWESARVTLNPDGSALAATGGSSQGHGRETAFAQIVAERLGISMDSVSVVHGDTEKCPNGIGALASRSTAIGGSAIRRACDEILAIKQDSGGHQEPVTAEIEYENSGEAWGYGCYIIYLSIDPATGILTIEAATCVDDVGNIINLTAVEGQIMGGFAQGLGEALMERIVYDDEGQLLTGSFTDYAVPRAADMPPLSISKLVTPSPCNELGAKGVGEAGTIGAPAAILNAAVDALRPLGVEKLQMPLTGEQLWRAIKNAQSGK